jgi:hypothetical protein
MTPEMGSKASILLSFAHSVEPADVAPLAKELHVQRKIVRQLLYQHFCSLDHLRDAAWALEAA